MTRTISVMLKYVQGEPKSLVQLCFMLFHNFNCKRRKVRAFHPVAVFRILNVRIGSNTVFAPLNYPTRDFKFIEQNMNTIQEKLEKCYKLVK